MQHDALPLGSLRDSPRILRSLDNDSSLIWTHHSGGIEEVAIRSRAETVRLGGDWAVAHASTAVNGHINPHVNLAL